MARLILNATEFVRFWMPAQRTATGDLAIRPPRRGLTPVLRRSIELVSRADLNHRRSRLLDQTLAFFDTRLSLESFCHRSWHWSLTI